MDTILDPHNEKNLVIIEFYLRGFLPRFSEAPKSSYDMGSSSSRNLFGALFAEVGPYSN